MNQLLTIDGVSVRRDLDGRYCLNDLHRAAGGAVQHRPSDWLKNKQSQELIEQLSSEWGISSLEGNQPVSVIHGGNSQGTYVIKELVYAYAMWISAAFSLKVIRTFDSVVTQANPVTNPSADKMQAGVILLESAAKMLNLSNSSKLGAYQKLQKVAGLPDLMPAYAIDAPAGAMDGSSRSTQSLSTLLKTNNIKMTANQAYHQLSDLGIVEQKTRPSRSGVNGVKKFWSLTAKGCMYGKNITSPVNPRETQPHFFESKSAELLRLMDTDH